MCLRCPTWTMLFFFSSPQIHLGLSFLKKAQPKNDPLSLPSTHLLQFFLPNSLIFVTFFAFWPCHLPTYQLQHQ